MNGPLKLFFYFRVLMSSLWINFKCLPFKQAIKLPILVYKPNFHSLKGKIMIENEDIHLGMIKMGFLTSVLYPNSGVMLKNDGKIIFKGECHIGNDCYIVCEERGLIVFGKNFKVTAGLKMVSVCGITFGENCLVGWGNIIIDTNFHPLFDIKKQQLKEKQGTISIGSNNWFAAQCVILPRVVTPPNCTFGTRSIITRGYNYESCCVYGGNPIKLLSRDVIRFQEDN